MTEKGIFVTINTDAGFFPIQKVASYAYWIKGNGIFIKNSGLFKSKCKGPVQAEMQAMINALSHLRQIQHPPIIGFVFNRDCVQAYPSNRGNELRQILHKEIDKFKEDAKQRIGKKMFGLIKKKSTQYAIFKHVVGHSDNTDKRSYDNQWCHNQCSKHLIEWLKQNKKNKHEAR